MNVATSFLTPQLKAQGLYRRPFLYHHWDMRHVWLREKFLQGALSWSSMQKENNSLFLHLHLLSGADITVQQRHILFFSTLVIKTLAGDSSCATPHVVLVLYMDQSLTPQLSLVTTLLFKYLSFCMMEISGTIFRSALHSGLRELMPTNLFLFLSIPMTGM